MEFPLQSLNPDISSSYVFPATNFSLNVIFSCRLLESSVIFLMWPAEGESTKFSGRIEVISADLFRNSNKVVSEFRFILSALKGIES